MSCGLTPEVINMIQQMQEKEEIEKNLHTSTLSSNVKTLEDKLATVETSQDKIAKVKKN